MFSRLEICHSELSQKCILTDESGLQEDGRTFLTECIPAVGDYHVAPLGGRSNVLKMISQGLINKKFNLFFFSIGQKEFSSDQGSDVLVKWTVQKDLGDPSLIPNRHLTPNSRCLHSKSVTNCNS